jgi:hypothetical protein
MSARGVAQEAWGADLPDWVEALVAECERSSQSKVAKALGYSPSVVSDTLRNRYPGDMQKVEDIIRGKFLSGTRDCPFIGSIALDVCVKWQERAGSDDLINTLHTRMRRACNSCPHMIERKEAGQ